MPPRRFFTEADRDQLLLAASLFRDACVEACRKAPPGGPAYEAASRGIAAVDDIASLLTGNRELFWTTRHTAGGPA